MDGRSHMGVDAAMLLRYDSRLWAANVNTTG